MGDHGGFDDAAESRSRTKKRAKQGSRLDDPYQDRRVFARVSGKATMSSPGPGIYDHLKGRSGQPASLTSRGGQQRANAATAVRLANASASWTERERAELVKR